MKFMNLKKKIAPVLMGGALAVATAVPVFAADASTSTGLSSEIGRASCRERV